MPRQDKLNEIYRPYMLKYERETEQSLKENPFLPSNTRPFRNGNEFLGVPRALEGYNYLFDPSRTPRSMPMESVDFHKIIFDDNESFKNLQKTIDDLQPGSASSFDDTGSVEAYGLPNFGDGLAAGAAHVRYRGIVEKDMQGRLSIKGYISKKSADPFDPLGNNSRPKIYDTAVKLGDQLSPGYHYDVYYTGQKGVVYGDNDIEWRKVR